MNRSFRVVALALTTLLLACGGGNGKVPAKAASDASSASSDSARSDATADPSDACSLLSQSEAEEAIGSKLKEAPKAEADPLLPDTHGCSYKTSDAARAFAIEVFDKIEDGKTFIRLKSKDGTTIDGVGDNAIYDEDFHRVYVLSGDTAFAIRFVIGDLDDEQDAGAKIAAAVVGNL